MRRISHSLDEDEDEDNIEYLEFKEFFKDLLMISKVKCFEPPKVSSVEPRV